MDSPALRRLNLVKNQLKPALAGGVNRTTPKPKTDDDVVIVDFARTALCKAKKGNFRDTAPETMLKAVFEAVVNGSGIDKSKIDDICVGNCLQPGSGGITSRMAQFLAGIPHTTSLQTLNRQCSSGIQAVAHIAHAIEAGSIDIGIGAGVENMTNFTFNDAIRADLISDPVFEHEEARNCLMGMGVTSDNVAKEFGVTREDQDKFAAWSQQKALAAQENGDLQKEITPITTTVKDKDGNE